jgi:hypothetical protein
VKMECGSGWFVMAGFGIRHVLSWGVTNRGSFVVHNLLNK